MKKKELMEIIDSNNDLIGSDAVPKNGSDLESQASNTTDYNVGIGTQPFRYDMLGRFGFTLMPFFEGKENDGQLDMKKDLNNLLKIFYGEILEFYYRNPNKLKSDFRKYKNDEVFEFKFNSIDNKIIKTIEKHFEKSFKSPENIDESKVVEDKVIGSKKEDEISKKNDSKDLREKHLEKIAGLIGKLDKKDIDKLINLLEVKK